MAVQTLTNAFSGLSVQDASGHRSASHAPKVVDRSGANLPAPGTVLTVKHMTPEQEQGIRHTLQTLAEQERVKAAALEQIRQVEESQQGSRARIAEAQTRIAENQENLKVEREKYAAETQKYAAEMQKIGQLCQAVAAKFQTIRPLNLSDPTALGKIDAYLRTVDSFKKNIPDDSTLRNEQIKKLQAEAQVVLASVKTK